MRRYLTQLFIIFLVLSIFLALSVGGSNVGNLWSALLNPTGNEILWQIRIPRIAAALIVGAALGIAGLMAQGACNNPLAEPTILGTSAGASLGAILAILTGVAQVGSMSAIICGAIGALLATSLTFVLASRRNRLSSFSLIIVGIAISATLTSVAGLASSMVTRADARSISFWNFGSLALITQENLIGLLVITVIGIAVAIKIAPSLDVLSLGDSTAFHLGVDVRRTRAIALVGLSLLAGAAVSTVGIIAFVGLAAPHIARFVFGPAHRPLVAYSALIGSIVVVLADTAARTIAQPNELSIGLLTSLLGAPILIALVTIKENTWRMQ